MAQPQSAMVESRRFHAARLERRHAEREALRQHKLDAARQAILDIAPACRGLERVFLFGSILQPGRFRSGSDIDVAVVGGGPELESRFWRQLEQTLGKPVDVRPCRGPIATAVELAGEVVYARAVATA